MSSQYGDGPTARHFPKSNGPVRSSAGDQIAVPGERDTPNGRELYMARPMKVSSMACMTCHDTPEGAPAPDAALADAETALGRAELRLSVASGSVV